MMFEKSPQRLKEMVAAPDWYVPFKRYVRQLRVGSAATGIVHGGNPLEATRNSHHRLEEQFEELLESGAVMLGSPNENLENWDEERTEIDRIVLHHTSRPSGLSLQRLNAMHLLRLYVPRYQSDHAPVLDSDGNRQPIYSGHFDTDGNQVFYGYHHLVREDGQTERLLPDTATGWHAGDWDINCRSIAICIDGDLSDKVPTDLVVTSIAELINNEYPAIAPTAETIIGHNEVIGTECPGDRFLNGWKLELLEKLESLR